MYTPLLQQLYGVLEKSDLVFAVAAKAFSLLKKYMLIICGRVFKPIRRVVLFFVAAVVDGWLLRCRGDARQRANNPKLTLVSNLLSQDT